MCTACFHCDAETWYRVKLFGLIGLVWSGLFALGCVYVRYAVPAHYDANAKHSWNKKTCHVNSYSISTIDPNRRLEALPAAGSSAEAPRRLSDDDADDGSMTYYAVLQVTVSPCPDGLDADKCHEYDTAAVKYPSWAAGSGGSSLHGWVSKRNAKKWAKQYVADTDYTCWKMPGDKRTVSIQNPGYHYRWQVALGAGAMAATAAPIAGVVLGMLYMYYVLAIKPGRKHRAEALRMSRLRSKGDSRLNGADAV
ncbi:hypothetical protein M885DRAFT_517862 [Pelagophyceae sp. CCMP2097]|nr:hypothetical protein M885DRAFT_517862 [Pelagophyceae sp. CCMP2097]